MTFQTLKDFNLAGKTVLLRADLNVPRQDGKVTDTARIDRLKPTIDALTQAKAKVLILSHFGRPDGGNNPQMSLAFLVPVLQECWGHDVSFAPDCIGEPAQSLASRLEDGQIGLLENLRFHKGEQQNDPEFAAQLASLGDIFVNDAFSAAHRAHASTEGITHHMPCAAGLLMQEELNALEQALGNPERPVAAVAGGSKVSTKIDVLRNLSARVDFLILGGGMANTFLHARGANVGSSLCEKDMAETAREIEAYAKENGCEIILPSDCVCAQDLKPGAESKIYDSGAIPEGWRAIDAGPQSIENICNKIENCKTVVWNGPLGVFEIKPFDSGTNALAKFVADKTKDGKMASIAGGGDTVSALDNAGCLESFSYISTAGGAFLEWLEGKTLPGVAALSTNKKAA